MEVKGYGAKMNFYEKEKGEWRLVERGIDVKLGRNGVGKLKEGDGKTPSGIYRLGDLYGYREVDTRMPFFLSTEDTVCVDDTASRYYNRIVDRRYVIEDFKSFEHMKRKDDLYEIVVTVGYNPHNKAPLGSCIFLHISNGDKPTAGCVAMKKEALERIVKRLDPKKAPVLVVP